MQRIWFDVELLADVVVSESSATAGGHTSLDYLPGALFLGACAGGLYAGLDPDDAFTLFHGGRVRFGNAFPLSGNERALPMPNSWYHPKEQKAEVEGWLQTDHLVNLAAVEWQKSVLAKTQPKQVRDGYFVPRTGAVVRPARRHRMKTAIDRASGGRPEESMLFGYQALAAGSHWRFALDLDADIPAELGAKLAQWLDGRTLRLGRSRAAEYGLARVVRAKSAAAGETATANGSTLILYCLADLALRDVTTGMPTLVPTAAHFGLPEGARLEQARSFIRCRSYAPFNGKRRAFDLERQVITKGSVLAFTASLDAPAFKALVARCRCGIGQFRQDGLGQLLVNPSWLMAEKPGFDRDRTVVKTEIPVTPESDLTTWLAEQKHKAEREREALALAITWRNDFLKQDRRPSNSQWGRVRQDCLQAAGGSLGKLFFEQRDRQDWPTGVRKNWGADIWAEGGKTSCAALLRKKLDTIKDDTELQRLALYHLAGLMQREGAKDRKEGRA